MPAINDMNTLFCNEVWKTAKPAIQKAVSKSVWKDAYHYIDTGSGYRDAEFQIPSENFYWHGDAWCVADAKYKGWNAYLRSRNLGEV
jgi:hypothetical protein